MGIVRARSGSTIASPCSKSGAVSTSLISNTLVCADSLIGTDGFFDAQEVCTHVPKRCPCVWLVGDLGTKLEEGSCVT